MKISILLIFRRLTLRLYRNFLLAIAALLSFMATNAQAATIEYTTTSLGGTQWQYDYAITNDSLDAAIDEFTIFFAQGLYSNVMPMAAPAGWDAIAVNADPALGSAGFFDAAASGTGIAPGKTLAGFSATFNFLGSGLPGAQTFDIVDPVTFVTLQNGVTSSASAVSVPSPAVWALMLVGALPLLGSRRRQPNAPCGPTVACAQGA